MLCRDIMKVIENTYPKHAAMEWDNVGLLVGCTEKEVRKIYVALDATDEIIEDVISQGADMLVTHHPLIFSPLKQITNEQLIGRRVVKLLQHDISYYAMHTNYDVLGMADLSSRILGLSGTEILEMTNEERAEGFGRVGKLPKTMTVRECCEHVKHKFHLNTVKVYGDLDASVKRVAISPGSGKHMSELALKKGAEVFITAEIDHHEGLDSNAEGMAIIDAGHYGLEHIFVEDMAAYLQENLASVEIVKASIVHPFQVI